MITLYDDKSKSVEDFLDIQKGYMREVNRVLSVLEKGPRYVILPEGPHAPKAFRILDSKGQKIVLSGRKGVYLYWAKGVPLYVGESSTCLRDRLGYFIASVWDKSHSSENHHGGNVYRMLHGTGNFDDLLYSYVEVDEKRFDTKSLEAMAVQYFNPSYKNHLEEYKREKMVEEYDGHTLESFFS